MIRVVLAVILGATLFGIAIPSVERADQDRNTALAVAELEQVNETAERLADENDPVASANRSAVAVLHIAPPEPIFVEPGRFRIDDTELRWIPPSGNDKAIRPAVPIQIEEPTIVSERSRIQLSLVRLDGESVIHVQIGPKKV